MRKASVAVVIAIVAITALAGCTGIDSASVLTYHQMAKPMPSYEGVTDETLTASAKSICRIFTKSKGAGLAEAHHVALQAQTADIPNSEQAGMFVGFAVDAYCRRFSVYVK